MAWELCFLFYVSFTYFAVLNVASCAAAGKAFNAFIYIELGVSIGYDDRDVLCACCVSDQ